MCDSIIFTKSSKKTFSRVFFFCRSWFLLEKIRAGSTKIKLEYKKLWSKLKRLTCILIEKLISNCTVMVISVAVKCKSDSRQGKAKVFINSKR